MRPARAASPRHAPERPVALVRPRDAGTPGLSANLRLALFYRLVRSVDAADTVEEATDTVLRLVCNALGWKAATFWRIDPASDVLRPVAVADDAGVDAFKTATLTGAFPRGEGLPGRVWETGQPTWITDFADTSFPRAGSARRRGLHAAFACPVSVNGRVLGVVEFFGGGAEPRDADLLDMMAIVGRQLGLFIAQREMEDALRIQEQRAQQVVDSALDAIVTVNGDGVLTGWNARAEETFGWSALDVVGTPLAEVLIPPRYREAHTTAFNRLVATGRPGRVLSQRVRIEALHRDGHELPVELTVSQLPGGDHTMSAFIRDLTAEQNRERELAAAVADQIRANEELRRSHNLLQAVVEGTRDIVFVKDVEGRYQLVNQAATEFLGLRTDEVIGRRDIDLFDAGNATVHAARDAEVRLSGRLRTTQHQVGTGEDARIFEATAGPYRDGDGNVIGTFGISRDVTDQKRLERELAHRALHDPLTGLANRALFIDRLGQALARAQRTGAKVGVAFLDLDQFKIINDGLGHTAADTILVAVARRLQSAVRDGDTVARFGGDEFMVVWEDSPGDVTAVAQRLIDALQAPFTLDDGAEIYVRASVGVATAGTAAEPASELVRRADAAMYRAKQRGRNRVEVFEPGIDIDPRSRLSIANALARAVDRNEMFLEYQPVVHVGSNAVVAVEALVRWNHPEHGVVPPSTFIPLAEETGDILRITSWVLGEALRRCGSWHRAGLDVGVAVNVSAHDIANPDFPRVLRGMLEMWQTPPHLVTIEITESVVMLEPDRTLQVLHQLRDLGVRLSIDDFGTGYSSLAYVQRLPVNEIKIDRSFASTITTDAHSAAIVRSTIELAHDLELDVLAEGVEDADVLERLRASGCDRVQGYHIAPAMPLDNLRRWMTDRQVADREGAEGPAPAQDAVGRDTP
jgi:diguanylate cyclase (GGDEF)-like protein/PAS domain S-box-containing protein